MDCVRIDMDGHSIESDDYQLETITSVRGKTKKIIIWIRNYSWRYLVYKIHMENL